MYQVVTPGIGCAGGSCNCGGKCHGGMGQASSLSTVGTDFTTLLGDVFLNPDGSVNVTAIAFAAVAGLLIFRNWGNTTRRGKR